MQQIQEKSDTLSNSLCLSAPGHQQSHLQVGRKVIDTSEFRSLNSKIKKDSAKRSQAKLVKAKEFGIRPVAPKDTILTEPRVMVAIPEIPPKANVILPEKAFLRKSSDWALGIIILSLIIIASVRIIFNTYLKQLFNATINYATAARLFREKAFNLLHAAFRLDILFFLVTALFIYQSLQAFGASFGNFKPILVYLACVGVVIVYSLAKRFVYMTIAVITESQPETLEYLFNINIYHRVLGLVLFPFTLFIAFAPMHDIQPIIATGIAVCILFFGQSLLRGSKILLRKHFSISYLILYLCTLEFLPLLVIYKVITG